MWIIAAFPTTFSSTWKGGVRLEVGIIVLAGCPDVKTARLRPEEDKSVDCPMLGSILEGTHAHRIPVGLQLLQPVAPESSASRGGVSSPMRDSSVNVTSTGMVMPSALSKPDSHKRAHSWGASVSTSGRGDRPGARDALPAASICHDLHGFAETVSEHGNKLWPELWATSRSTMLKRLRFMSRCCSHEMI